MPQPLDAGSYSTVYQLYHVIVSLDIIIVSIKASRTLNYLPWLGEKEE